MVTTLDFGEERRDKNSVLTKEKKEIIEKLGFADKLLGCSLCNSESQVTRKNNF